MGLGNGGSGRCHGGCPEGRDQPPHPARQEVDVHLQEVVTGAGRRELEEVQADAAAPACRDGQREEQAGRAQVVGLDTLALRDVCLNVRWQALPPDRS
jgi:hypothetical protein